MHIAIDARVINSGTGTYIVKLLEYLQQIDNENSYKHNCTRQGQALLAASKTKLHRARSGVR